MNLKPASEEQLIMYGHNFCPQVAALRKSLAKHNVSYEWREATAENPQYQQELKALARGYLSVPTVIFEDGEVMVEPSPRMVLKKLGLE